MSRASFEIDASGEVQATAAHHNLSLVPNMLALEALAQKLRTPLPENPRLLLLNQGQIPHTPKAIIITPQHTYLPEYKDRNDILVYLGHGIFDEPMVTASVGQALVNRRRQAQDHQMKRVGGAIFGTGLVVSAVGDAAMTMYNPAQSYLGYAIAASGISLLAYYSNRGKAPPPDVQGMDAPIALVPKSTEESELPFS